MLPIQVLTLDQFVLLWRARFNDWLVFLLLVVWVAHIKAVTAARNAEATRSLLQLRVVIVKVVLGDMSLWFNLVADRFLCVWDHIESFEVVVFLVGKVERLQCPRWNQVSKGNCMVLVVYLTQASAWLTWTGLFLILQECFLLPADLMTHSSLWPNKILELCRISLYNQWILLLETLLFLVKTTLSLIVDLFA